MQLIVIATLIGVVGAFNVRTAARSSSKLSMSDRSQALPFDKCPDTLDGTLAGDRGFDPAGFTNSLPSQWLIGGEEKSLKWYREAEIVHSRVAMLAVVGQLFPTIAHFPGNPDIGVPNEAWADLNPYSAISSVPEGAVYQVCIRRVSRK